MSKEANPNNLSERPGYLSLSVHYLKFLCTCASIYGLGYFHLSPSWIFLGSLGYFIIQRARNKSWGISSSLKAIGENEKRFILEHFSVHDLPSWVYFPDVDRAEWLNKIIKRMWPSISEYTRTILTENFEPVVSENLPSALKPFRFLTIDLGDTPPRVGGVKVYMDESIRRDEIVMDFDLMIYSDARIKVSLGKVTAGVKDFELRGTLRAVLKPLVSKVPFAGAITVCFLDSPYISFQLTNMGNILGLPGLQQTLNTVIRDVVNQFIVLPNRVPIQLVSDLDVQRLKYPLPQGLLRINVIAGRNLKAGDKNVVGRNSSDPYCIVRVGAKSFKTAVVKHTLEPVWNEYFEAVVDVCHGQSVTIEVYDKDQGNNDDYLGLATIPVESIFMYGKLETWANLEGVKTGSIHLNFTWYQMSNKSEDFALAIEKSKEYRKLCGRPMSSGFLYVSVEQAINLVRVKQLQEPSPFCNLQLGRDCQATIVKERTQNPIWESVHHFLIGDPSVDILQIIVRDNRTETKLGTCSIPVNMLLSQKSMAVTQPFALQDCGPENSTIYLHLQLMALIPGEPQTVESSLNLINNSCSVINSNDTPHVGSDISFSALNESTLDNTDMTVRQRNVEQVTSAVPVTLDTESFSTLGVKDIDEHSPLLEPVNSVLSSNLTDAPFGSILLTCTYHPDSNILNVIVHEAKNLTGVDKDGLADPYVKLYLIDQHGTEIGGKFKTKVHKDNLNPVFDESFTFTVNSDEMPLATLKVEVKNHVAKFTRSGKTHNLGYLCIDLNSSLTVNEEKIWYPLLSPSA